MHRRAWSELNKKKDAARAQGDCLHRLESVESPFLTSLKAKRRPIMYYLSTKASRIRQREAQNARNNRAEIVKALSLGQITRRDLYKWGIFTAGGVLALKNGLSPFARSAFAAVPTGTPPSPLFGARKFTQPLNRLALQRPQPLTRIPHDANTNNDTARWPAAAGEVLPVSGAPKDAKRL